MRADERRTASLRLMLTHPQGGNDLENTHRVDLRVIDEVSGVVIADIEMTAVQFADLMSSRNVHVDARVVSEEDTAKLFKRREIETVAVPEKLGSRYDYARGLTLDVDVWLEEYRDAHDWDEARLNLGSQSFTATFSRWVREG